MHQDCISMQSALINLERTTRKLFMAKGDSTFRIDMAYTPVIATTIQKIS
jgi:hypothetical protein